MGKSRPMEVLQAMQEVGYVELHRTAPPYQVVLVRQDTEGLLKNYMAQTELPSMVEYLRRGTSPYAGRPCGAPFE